MQGVLVLWDCVVDPLIIKSDCIFHVFDSAGSAEHIDIATGDLKLYWFIIIVYTVYTTALLLMFNLRQYLLYQQPPMEMARVGVIHTSSD